MSSVCCVDEIIPCTICGLASKREICLILVCPEVMGWKMTRDGVSGQKKKSPFWLQFAVLHLFSTYGYLMLLRCRCTCTMVHEPLFTECVCVCVLVRVCVIWAWSSKFGLLLKRQGKVLPHVLVFSASIRVHFYTSLEIKTSPTVAVLYWNIAQATFAVGLFNEHEHPYWCHRHERSRKTPK